MHPRLHLREGQWSGGYCLSVGESNARYSASRLSSPRFCRVKIDLSSGMTLHAITFSIRLPILFHQKVHFPHSSPDAAWPARRKLAPHIPPLHDGRLSYLAVDEKVVEGKRSQRGYTSCDQLEVASLEKVAGSNQRSSF